MVNPLTFVSLRLIAYGLLGAALIGGGLWVRHEWNQGRAAIVEAQELRETLAAERAAKVAADAASTRYQDELERLRNRPVRTRVVRLCPDAPGKLPATQPRPDGPGSTGGVGDTGTRQDSRRSEPANEPANIGPDLYALAAQCDAVTAQLRGLQGLHSAER